ncbi:Uncharacterized protein Adt_31586 [Abeliophyllum distichum]|uniref:Uncharacterized protein n=1 Tax=Abeliophyllum distichum TaxID=126358 RepID=A0ABD1REL2_9LAMI
MSDEISISQKPTDTINLGTLKRMKIVKEHEQWVAKTKGFDMESGPSTLSFEGDEAMDDDGQDGKDLSPPSSIHEMPQSSFPSSSSDFTFFNDHYNLLNSQIDSLTSTVDGLQHSMDGFNSMLQQVVIS